MNSGTIQLVWAVVLIIAIPVTVLVVGELADRFRERSSAYAGPTAVLRLWVLPLAAALAISVAVFGSTADDPVNRVIATALLLTVVVVVFGFLRSLISGIKQRSIVERREAPPQLLLALPRVVLLVVAFWLLLAVIWGVELSRAVAALGVTSLIVSLALQQPLGSLASGLFLVADQPFRPGDWIQVGSDEGKVVDVNWRTTRLRNRNGSLVVMPNSKLADATIINFSQPERLHRVTLRVQVAFANPPARAVEMLMAAARNTPGVLDDPEPSVIVVSVDDPLMEYEIRVWIADHAQTPVIRGALGLRVWYYSERMGVPLPSPAQDLYLWDGPRVAADKQIGASQVRSRLAGSPLLGALPDADLDLLASDARVELFAPDEVVVDIGPGADDDIRVVVRGRAAFVADALPADGPRTGAIAGSDLESTTRPARAGSPVIEVTTGDVLSPVRDESYDGRVRRIVSVTECEIVVIGRATAELVIGRTPALADALERSTRSRRRRIGRMLGLDQSDQPTAGPS